MVGPVVVTGGGVVDGAPVVLFTADAAAWAGTTTDSTTGRIHLAGTIIAMVPAAEINLMTRRRFGVSTLIFFHAPVISGPLLFQATA